MSKRAKKSEPSIIHVSRIISGGPPEEPHKADPPRPLTQEEALEVLWSAKTMYLPDENGLPMKGKDGEILTNPKWCDAFVYATLRKEATMHHGDAKRVRVAPTGTRVLVTMVSRFGDVGIRDDRLVPASNGYYSRVVPEDLTDWNMAPELGPT